MTDLTFVIPFSPAHSMIVERAIQSVKNQTIPCHLVVIKDDDKRGPGWARNRGMEKARSQFVSFLDADDTVAPNFAETCLEVITPNHYVYTDWYDGGSRYGRAPSPLKVWTEKTFHLVTTVMHREDVVRVGGFDEVLVGAEDTDFGIRVRLSGVCGIHVAQALVLYQPGGTRSNELRNSPADMEIQRYFSDRYGGYNLMACCGANYETPVPLNEQQPNDVLMVAAWSGNRPYTGAVTGRRYGNRVGNFRAFWIDKSDAAAQPSLWRNPTAQDIQRTVIQPQYQSATQPPPPQTSTADDWQSVALGIFGGGQTAPQPRAPVEYKPNVPGRSKAAVLARAQQEIKGESGA